MDIKRVTSAVRELAELGRDRFEVVLRDGTGVRVPMGLDNAALTFDDQEGWVTFRIDGRPLTEPIRLEDVVTVRDVRGPSEGVLLVAGRGAALCARASLLG